MTDVAYPYQVGPNVAWPNVEALVRAWLVQNMPGVNVRTETDATFGTSTPNPSMVLPLILVNRASGSTDDEGIEAVADVDLQCFSDTRLGAENLFDTANAWMLRLTGQSTPAGAVDEVVQSSVAGVINYSNPNLRRFVVTYQLTTRPQSTI